MIDKPSGPTCDDVIIDTNPRPATFAMRLCNFPTSHSELLPAHVDALRKYFLAAAFPYYGGWVDVVGYASKLQYAKDETGNLGLSRDRCASVVRAAQPHMSMLGQPFRFNVLDGRGDSLSQDDPTQDHGFYRSVDVRLFAQGTPRYEPAPVLRHGYTTVSSREFEFQAIENASVSLSLFQADCMFFSIHDMRNRRLRYYSYVGAGPSAPIPKLPDVMASAGHGSRAVPFTTLIPFLEMEDFVGLGSLTGSVGVAFGGSVGGQVLFQMTPEAYARRSILTPISISFSFSHGFGANLANVGAGKISMLSESFRPTVYPDR